MLLIKVFFYLLGVRLIKKGCHDQYLKQRFGNYLYREFEIKSFIKV